MSSPTANDNDAPVRPVFQRLFEQTKAFAAKALNANERTNAFVKSLEILSLERAVLNASTSDDWRRRVEKALDAIAREISTVESRSERAYLRRLALDAALELNACDATFFAESFADATLAEIDDAEERQNALVAYASRLADRISNFPQHIANERIKAFALIDEIEDLRLFERAAANVLAAVVFNATQYNATTFQLENNAAPLDLTPFGDDVAQAWEQFESSGGFLELCERAAAERFALPFQPEASESELSLRQAFSDETRRRLQTILDALDSGVDGDGSPLNEDDRAELQSVVDEAVIASPFALRNGEFYRNFLERSRNLDAFVPIFERLAEAEDATAAPSANENAPTSVSANAGRDAIYRRLELNGAEEKARWLESARRVAARSAAFDADLRVKLDRLTTSAEIEFRFGDKTNGKNAVREALGHLSRLESPFERARFYRRLVAAHLVASYRKATQKLATLWKAELSAIEPEDLRDAAFAEAFDIYSQAVNGEEQELATFAETISSPLVRLDVETRRALDRLFSQDVSPVLSDAAEIANLIESSVKQLQSFEETAPDEAAFALVKIATALAARIKSATPCR